MGEIEGDMGGGESMLEIEIDLVLCEGVGVRKEGAAGDRNMDESTGAASAQSSELLLVGGWGLDGKSLR